MILAYAACSVSFILDTQVVSTILIEEVPVENRKAARQRNYLSLSLIVTCFCFSSL